jgi:hypothetical protein
MSSTRCCSLLGWWIHSTTQHCIQFLILPRLLSSYTPSDTATALHHAARFRPSPAGAYTAKRGLASCGTSPEAYPFPAGAVWQVADAREHVGHLILHLNPPRN